MKQVVCPHCTSSFPASVIPDDVILSERGRRNSLRANKRRPMVWKEHRNRGRCLCWDCLWFRLYSQEAAFYRTVERDLRLTGSKPPYFHAKVEAFEAWRGKLLAAQPKWVQGPPENPFLRPLQKP